MLSPLLVRESTEAPSNIRDLSDALSFVSCGVDSSFSKLLSKRGGSWAGIWYHYGFNIVVITESAISCNVCLSDVCLSPRCNFLLKRDGDFKLKMFFFILTK